MNILVIGGAGFVGNALIKELSKNEKYQIYSLDDYSTSNNHFSLHLLKNKTEIIYNNIHYIEGHSSEIFDKCSHIQPSIVFHFGEFSRIDRSWYEINRLMKSNLYGTSQVLEYCHKNKSFLVYSASSAVLGNNTRAGTREPEDNSKLTPYAWTKQKMVELIKCYHEWFGLQYLITYFYNVYGPGQISSGPYATVVGIFEEQYKKGEPLTVVKPGTQSRCFTHIDDIVSGLIKGFNNCYNKEIQICSNDELSILELANLFIQESSNNNSKILLLEERKGDRKTSTKLSRDILREELGWECKNNIKDYLKNKINNI
jgi:UDP-glucose 4-epimerase